MFYGKQKSLQIYAKTNVQGSIIVKKIIIEEQSFLQIY